MIFNRPFALCVLATIVVSFGIFVQFNLSEWSDQLYFNGDNITLAMVVKSIIEGQPFRWVFSSQTFLFPEGPLFFASYILSGNLQASLITNAYLNLFLLGISVFLLGRKLLRNTQNSFLALATFFALLSLMLVLESKPDINGSTILTPVLYATYYSGVVIVALFSLLLLGAINSAQNNRILFLSFFYIFFGGLAYSSDPLYLLQAFAPLTAASLTLFIVDKKNRKFSVMLFALTIASFAIGLVIRYVTSSYAVASVGNYIDLAKIGLAFTGILSIIRNSIDEPFHAFLWLFLTLLFVVHAVFSLKLLRKDDYGFGYSARLVHFFFFVSPLITIAGVLLTGNFYTRYLLPLPIFTLIGFSLMLPRVIPNRSTATIVFGTLVFTVCYFCIGYMSTPREPTRNELDVSCYRNFAIRYNLHPVGGYWTSRYLTLYSPSEHQVFQVLDDFKSFNWLSNKIDHSNTSINAVIVDHERKPFLIDHADTEILGSPSIIYTCGQFDIYVYPQPSEGNKILNERIRQ